MLPRDSVPGRWSRPANTATVPGHQRRCRHAHHRPQPARVARCRAPGAAPAAAAPAPPQTAGAADRGRSAAAAAGSATSTSVRRSPWTATARPPPAAIRTRRVAVRRQPGVDVRQRPRDLGGVGGVRRLRQEAAVLFAGQLRPPQAHLTVGDVDQESGPARQAIAPLIGARRLPVAPRPEQPLADHELPPRLGRRMSADQRRGASVAARRHSAPGRPAAAASQSAIRLQTGRNAPRLPRGRSAASPRESSRGARDPLRVPNIGGTGITPRRDPRAGSVARTLGARRAHRPRDVLPARRPSRCGRGTGAVPAGDRPLAFSRPTAQLRLSRGARAAARRVPRTSRRGSLAAVAARTGRADGSGPAGLAGSRAPGTGRVHRPPPGWWRSPLAAPRAAARDQPPVDQRPQQHSVATSAPSTRANVHRPPRRITLPGARRWSGGRPDPGR